MENFDTNPEAHFFFNQKDTATIAAITPHTLVNYSIVPVKKGTKNMYDIRIVIAEKIKRMENKSGAPGLNQSRRRFAEAQAINLEMEIKKKQGELIPSDKATLFWSGIITSFRSKLLALPGRLQRIIPGIDPTKIEPTTKNLILEILEEFKQNIEDVYKEMAKEK